jgi:sarcosine oxidase subunit alpha
LSERTDICVVGAGPAGLSAAQAASKLGLHLVVVDDNERVGGQLIKQTHKFFGSQQHYCGVRGIDIARLLYESLPPDLVQFWFGSTVIGYYPGHILGVLRGDRVVEVEAQRLIIATGATENLLAFPGSDLPGVYGAGAVQTLMNVHGVRPGKRVLMIGSGNIGLIVSYQLLQAGVDVAGVVEALPEIGGYLVHAAKIRRMGVPIYVSHTIVEAIGTEDVEGAVIAQIDGNWQPVAGTERSIDCDVICLSVGLNPLSDLLRQAGCRIRYVSELGGWVALHDQRMETTVPGIYVCGDVSGIEEAVTAMLEGRIAGAAAAWSLDPSVADQATTIIEAAQEEIDQFRSGPVGENAWLGKQELMVSR